MVPPAITDGKKKHLVLFPLISSTLSASKGAGILKPRNQSTAQFQQLTGLRGKGQNVRKETATKTAGLGQGLLVKGQFATGRSGTGHPPALLLLL